MTFLSFALKKSYEEYVPDLSRSNTDETPISANPSKEDLFLQTKTSSGTGKRINAPATPEGLRPRQTPEELRQSLGLPPSILHEVEKLQAALLPRPTMPLSLPCLPPRNYPAFSPGVSRSSFYSRESSSTMVAESPNLNPGQTLTAVGALLAQNDKGASLPPRKTCMILPPRTLLGVLPPRTWLDELETEEDVYSDTDSIGYHHLNDSADNDPATPNQVRFVDQDAYSPGSHTTTSFPVSPIRRVAAQTQSGVNMSFSSQLALVESGKGMHLYNFDPIIVAADQLTNVSAISQSMADDCSLVSYSHSADYSIKHIKQSMAHHLYEFAMDEQLIQRKQQNQRKAKEQLLMDVVERLQDDLDLLEQVEQLHEGNDGVEHWFTKTDFKGEGLLTGYSEKASNTLLKYFRSLLAETETTQSEEFLLSPTPMGGYNETNDDLRCMLRFMIRLIQVTPPMMHRWVCYSELRTAMGIPVQPESPATPRGGDTSMFSLPSESTTPHTSNLSMTSTITTKQSPTFRRSKVPLRMQEHVSSIRRTTEIVGTILQQMTLACNKIGLAHNTIVVEATEDLKRLYLQLMTMPHNDLICFVQSFGLEEEEDDARVSANNDLVRQVSNDENEGPHSLTCVPDHYHEKHKKQQQQQQHDLAYNKQISATQNVTWMCSPNSDDMRTATVVMEDDDDGDDDDDDNDDDCHDERYDDLRRTVGSNDYDGGDMEREQAPEEGCRQQQQQLCQQALRSSHNCYY